MLLIVLIIPNPQSIHSISMRIFLQFAKMKRLQLFQRTLAQVGQPGQGHYGDAFGQCGLVHILESGKFQGFVALGA